MPWMVPSKSIDRTVLVQRLWSILEQQKPEYKHLQWLPPHSTLILHCCTCLRIPAVRVTEELRGTYGRETIFLRNECKGPRARR